MLIQKLQHTSLNFSISGGERPLLLFFSDFNNYRDFIENRRNDINSSFNHYKFESLTNESLSDIYDYRQFIEYISGNFDARFFNSVKGTDFTVIKESSDIEKMKREYNFYRFIPDEMKNWFVMPYNFQENKEGCASYVMERYGMPDMALRYVHGAVSIQDLDMFLSKAMRFLVSREKRKYGHEECKETQNNLYFNKVHLRIEKLKKDKQYPTLESYIKNGTNYDSLDDIVKKYIHIFHSLVIHQKEQDYLVVGHGDFCFSNILYDTNTTLMRFIDPMGALQEKDIYSDPYYDIAKLSHSICGRYDFFNYDLYDVMLNDELKFVLVIDYNNSKRMAKYLLFRSKKRCHIQLRSTRTRDVPNDCSRYQTMGRDYRGFSKEPVKCDGLYERSWSCQIKFI